jgi:hypothetical protein
MSKRSSSWIAGPWKSGTVKLESDDFVTRGGELLRDDAADHADAENDDVDGL